MKSNIIRIYTVLLVAFLFITTANAESIRCVSSNGEYRQCGSNIFEASIAQLLSDFPCILGQSYGVTSGRIWVSNNCSALFRVRFTEYNIGVKFNGEGTGYIIDNYNNIYHQSSSEIFIPHSGPATLHAVPENGSRFTGWSGDCTGTGNCILFMDHNRKVGVHFGRLNNLIHLSLLFEGSESPDIIPDPPGDPPPVPLPSGTCSSSPQTVTWQGQEWQRCSGLGAPSTGGYSKSLFSWEEANTYCQELVTDGKDDWRLPTIDELRGLVVCTNGTPVPLEMNESCQSNLGSYTVPTIDPSFECLAYWYWSSTEYPGTNRYLRVYFSTGLYGIPSSGDLAAIRCVR